MDGTLKRLIALINEADAPAVRRAAVQVIGTLKPAKEPALHKALLAALDAEDVDLRRLAVNTLGDLRVEEALPRLVKLVEVGGPDVDPAVQALGHLGVRGTKALSQVMSRVAPGLRRRIAAGLALAGTESAVLATVHTLLDEDAGVVEASARSLASEVPLLSASQKRALAEHLLEHLASQPKRGRKPAVNSSTLSSVSEAAILRVLAALHPPEAEDAYWERVDPQRPAPLRSVALQALAALSAPSTDAKLHKLLTCAADRDFQVVAPALMILKKMPATRKNVKHWLALFDAPDVAAHTLAVEKLRAVDSAEVAKALLRQLRHADKALRDASLAAMLDLKAGRQLLYQALLEAASPDEVWTLARAQVDTARSWPTAQRTKMFAQACAWQDGDDRRADALWFLLREIDADGTRGRLEDRALALRKKKDFAASLGYWRLLTRDPAVGSELRFQLAATLLKVSSHDPAAAARDADPALHQFNRLLQDPGFDLIGAVRKAKWLDEEDLFYLGFHFAEQQRLARTFGQEVLEIVVKRSPKSQLAKNAKHKLKSEGLA
jgi:HEAT repeat protein